MSAKQQPSVDGLFIAPDADDRLCIWHERDPGDEFPAFVMGKPVASFRVTPERRLWDLLAAILPEREA